MPIKVLDKQVISQIAAGEVVERPASVVKELVENSLDAGSSQIAIEVRGGGVSLIRVIDNGVGIPSAEIGLAFERYATSKIGSLEDLQSIGSLGFRGEALPSIAAVAQVDIVTCTERASVGTYLSLADGVIVSRKKQARSQGTTVTVWNLFRKVPARLKFLKSVSTENSHIANVVSQYALAFPEVGFSLLIDGKSALRTAGRGRLIDSVIEVYGIEIARNMLEIKDSEWEGGTASPRITGMVGSPAVSRSSRDYLSFFINRRWVSSRLLSWAVTEAYHGLLMAGKYPIAVLNILLPLSEVDVNIHPTKSEVKFQNERRVFAAVQKAVRQALVEQMPVPKIEEVATTYVSPPGREPALWTSAMSDTLTTPPSETPQTMAASLPVLRVLGQLMSSYIIAEGPDGLYLIDQHAAHERILFEQVNQQRSRQEIEVQGLLEPATFEVNPKQDEVLKSRYTDLAEFGFSIEPFGNRTYLIRTVPHLLSSKDWARTLRELLDSFSGESESGWREEIATSIACHGAVRVGQVLTDDEMRELVRQLEQVATPHTCPHGRPVMIHLSSGQLRREFRRG
ncbi:MAG: DNA mismatch repair endonuclease MutL [Dehalococcoidales bacterium]